MSKRRRKHRATVSPEVEMARVHCHDAFDRLWEWAPAYVYFLDQPERDVTKAALVAEQRENAYAWLSAQVGATLTDIDLCDDLAVLRRIWTVCADARRVGPRAVADWIAQRAAPICLPDMTVAA